MFNFLPAYNVLAITITVNQLTVNCVEYYINYASINSLHYLSIHHFTMLIFVMKRETVLWKLLKPAASSCPCDLPSIRTWDSSPWNTCSILWCNIWDLSPILYSLINQVNLVNFTPEFYKRVVVISDAISFAMRQRTPCSTTLVIQVQLYYQITQVREA